MDVGQWGWYAVLPIMGVKGVLVDESLRGKAMVDVGVMDGPQGLLAIDVGLSAIDRKPLGAVDCHNPHPERLEF